MMSQPPSPRPLVSCIVPVRNGAEFLAEALGSILSQRRDGSDASSDWLDVIVIDDGSTDESAAIAAGHDGVRVQSQPGQGLATARNAGLALARGEFIAFLDADDIWLPGKLDRQLKLLSAHPEADLCLCMVQHVTTMPSLDAGAENLSLPDDEPRLGRLMQCLLARRRAFDIVGGFDGGTRTRGDQDWFIRARDAGLAEIVVPEVLALRRIHGNNQSLNIDSKVTDDLLTIVKRTLDRRRGTETGTGGSTWTPDARNDAQKKD